MRPQTPDAMRDIAYAVTRDGLQLPVIDISNARFSVPDDPQSLDDLNRRLQDDERRRRLIPAFVLRWMIRSAARQSKLVAALFGAGGTYLDGISTYVMKLGAANLVPPYDSAVDRKFAASPHATFLRLRTQQMATLIAEGLAAEIIPGDGTPLHLINIGGGPAIDSLNALILLARLRDALTDRKITIHVLDLDEAGVFFGRNALAAMMEEGKPLAGLDIAFQHVRYDWNDRSGLKALLAELASENPVIVASSEGALFEYGSDQAIVENLEVLRIARFVAGSVTRADETRRRLVASTRFKLILRGLAVFALLAERAGFSIEKVSSTVWSDQVLMRPG